MLESLNVDPAKYDELTALVVEYGVSLIGAIVILIAGWVIGNWVRNRIQKVNRLDGTLQTFLGGFAKYVVLAVAIVAVLGQFGVETASLLAVLGAAGLAIGLALQGTLSNVAAGVMLLILRPFNVGDYIEAGGKGGTVKSLGLFVTELATPDNVYVFLPNSMVWNTDIKNYARNNTRRQDINFGIAYDADIPKALKVIQKILDSEKRCLSTPDDKKPVVLTSNMGDSSVDMIARFWCKKEDYWDLKWDLTQAIKESLDSNKIDIPFPTRTLHVINEEAEAVTKDKKKKAA